MNVYSFPLSLTDESQIINRLKKYQITNANPYINYLFKIGDVSISIYKSHKCVIQGKNAEAVMNQYFRNYSNTSTQNQVQLPTLDFNNYSYLIGSDEVGVGDYFGGLVVCACRITPKQISDLQTLGVQDSKNLTNEKILELAPQIMEQVGYKIASISAKEYNLLYDKYHNSHVIKTLLHNRAIINLINFSHRSQYFVILDEYASASNYYKYLDMLGESRKVKIDRFETKAESKYIVVACASIIARYFFIQQLQELSQTLQMPIPFGAWNTKIEAALIALKKQYPDGQWQDYVKFHFKNSSKV